MSNARERRRSLRTALVLVVFAVVAVVGPGLVVAAPGNPPVYVTRKPLGDTHTTSAECMILREGRNDDGPYVLLMNRCDRVIYVSIQEWMDQQPVRVCAVFGLSGRGYGKLYRGHERADTETMHYGRDQEEIIGHCLRSGYDMTGGGIGTFYRTVDDSIRRERLAKNERERVEACEAELAQLDAVLNRLVARKAGLAKQREPLDRLREQLEGMSRRMLTTGEGAKFTAMADRYDAMSAAYTAERERVDVDTRTYNDDVNAFNARCAGYGAPGSDAETAAVADDEPSAP